MSVARVGLLGAAGLDGLAGALGERCEVVLVTPDAASVAAADVEAWCVHVPEVPAAVLQVARDGDVPALFLVPHEDARPWLRVLRKGVHDLAWLPVDLDEVRARLLALLARHGLWNNVSASLCRELAHDLRGPLQALTFTVAALQNDGAVAEGFEEDIDALLEATDVADVMLDGISNLGRRAQGVGAETPVQDLTAVVRAVAGRRAFGGRVSVDSGEPLPIRCSADALKAAVEDVIRVPWARAAGRRQVQVQCFRFGDEGVVSAQARAYDALLEHHQALLWRERPILLRRERVPMPLAGLAYARDVARAAGGELSVRRLEGELQVELRVPLALG